MKRKLLALLLSILLLAAMVPSAFALSGEQTRAADTLYTLGLVNGTGGTSGYALSSPATRAQAIAVIVRLSGFQSAATAGKFSTSFTDLPTWAKKDIGYAYDAGWASGLSTTAFGSTQAVSANAYCAFLLRMLGYQDADGAFLTSDAVQFARHIGLISRDYSTGAFTRGDLFEITVDAMTFHYLGSTETVASRLVSKGIISSSAANALGILDKELTARQVADRCTAAVFQLNCYTGQIYIDSQTPSSNSSGFFISKNGLAVTNYHSIKRAIYATITMSTGEQYKVDKVLYYNSAADVAVIQIGKTSLENVTTSSFPYLELAADDETHTGDTVYAIGNPLGLGLAVSSGIVSDAARKVDGYVFPCIMDTANISQGSSGGALLNLYGQVIGITCGAYTYGNDMYLAVPISPVLNADLSGDGWTLAEVAAVQAAADAAADNTGTGSSGNS